MPANDVTGVAASEEVVGTRFESAWEKGELFEILSVSSDQSTNLASNAIVADMIREKIREKVDDPDVAEVLLSSGLSLRYEATLFGHQLLRDLQPGERRPRRSAKRTLSNGSRNTVSRR